MTAAARRRDARRRQLLLLATTAIVVLGTAPIFGHHVAGAGARPAGDLGHLGRLCLVAFHQLLQPVHQLLHLLLLGGLGYAALERARAWLRLRRVLRALPSAAPSPEDAFWAAAAAVGFDPARVLVVPGLPTPAFTAGWLRPRIYVAEVLRHRLSAPELRALLAHEAAHARRYDPLRRSALRFLALTLFWIPALRRLADDMADEAELRADDAAAAQRPLPLATALLAVAGWPASPDGAHAADIIGVVGRGGTLLERRVRRLAGEPAGSAGHVTRRSLVGAMAALALVWASGDVAAHPLPAAPAAARALHCAHTGQLPLLHLICAPNVGALPCPHTTAAQ